jgi:hypothetical protein
MPPAGLEPTIATREWPHSYASDRTTTGIGGLINYWAYIEGVGDLWQLIGGNGATGWFWVKISNFLDRVNGHSSVIYLVSLCFSYIFLRGSRHSVVGIVTRLEAGRSAFESRQEQENFCSPNIRTGCGASLASFWLGTRAVSPWVKRPGCEVGHSTPNAKVMNECSCTFASWRVQDILSF